MPGKLFMIGGALLAFFLVAIFLIGLVYAYRTWDGNNITSGEGIFLILVNLAGLAIAAGMIAMFMFQIYRKQCGQGSNPMSMKGMMDDVLGHDHPRKGREPRPVRSACPDPCPRPDPCVDPCPRADPCVDPCLRADPCAPKCSDGVCQDFRGPYRYPGFKKDE